MLNRVSFVVVALIFSLTGSVAAAPAPEKWAIWDKADASSVAVIDHSLWQKVLDAHLKSGADGINRFGYRELAAQQARPGKESAGSLEAYLQLMAQIDPRDYNAAEQQAYWINLYNALTVDLVLKHPKKNSILRMGERFFSIGPWADKVYEVAGEMLTLNDIEHRILRPIFQDHRVHYAVNCASIGCPNLAAAAFTGVQLDAQLAAQERDYINHPRAVALDERGRLTLSQIFEWYASDFAPDQQGLLAYLARHHATLGDELAAYSGAVKYAYDWDLNKTQ